MRRLIDIIFPPRCLGCGDLLLPEERPHLACDPCASTMHRVESPRCPRCALPRESTAGVDSICGRCIVEQPSYDRVEACWVYDGAVSDAIRRAKASGDPSTLRDLAERSAGWFAQQVERAGEARWLTPPPDVADLRRRGWEPARTLARRLTVASGRSITWADPLMKVRSATKQALLDRRARYDALKGAFTARTSLSGTFVVFDDVMTTGATMNAVAGALKAAGANRVVGIVLARSV
jgi:predicted amidophosphoribosyltransferase